MYVEYSFGVDQGRGAVAPAPDRTTADFLQTPGSEIGFKGEEKLGGGLSAWFQCESTADPRGLSQNGWCGRNSALGMKGGFGNVFIGNWDTPFKRTISPTAVGGNDTGIWGTAFLLTGNSTTTFLPGPGTAPLPATPAGAAAAIPAGASRGTFKRRQNDSINYDSPNFGGFQVMLMTTSAQTTTGAPQGSNDKPRVMSIGGQYSAGPLYIGAGYEKHLDFNGAGRNGDDSGWHIGAAYTWGPIRFGGQYTRQEYEQGTTAAPLNAHVAAYHIGMDWRIVGPHGLRAAWTHAGHMKGTPGGGGLSGRPVVPAFGLPNDTSADLLQIRYVYTFSKRTEFNFGYVKLANDGNPVTGGSAYTLGGITAPIAGENQHAFAASVRHTF
jgi:predicted porin